MMRGARVQPFASSHPGAYMYDHRLHMTPGLQNPSMPNELRFAADRRRSESALLAGQEMRLRAHRLADIQEMQRNRIMERDIAIVRTLWC